MKLAFNELLKLEHERARKQLVAAHKFRVALTDLQIIAAEIARVAWEEYKHPRCLYFSQWTTAGAEFLLPHARVGISVKVK